jgi:hypothetical protein
MRNLYRAAFGYMVLGLLAGMFYREFTKANDFTGNSQLSVLHTHLLVLGMVFFLIALAIEKVFTISRSKLFTPFFWTYNVGVLMTTAMMLVHGIMTVRGQEVSPAISGIAGLGHILVTVALVLFFIALGKNLTTTDNRTSDSDQADSVTAAA